MSKKNKKKGKFGKAKRPKADTLRRWIEDQRAVVAQHLSTAPPTRAEAYARRDWHPAEVNGFAKPDISITTTEQADVFRNSREAYLMAAVALPVYVRYGRPARTAVCRREDGSSLSHELVMSPLGCVYPLWVATLCSAFEYQEGFDETKECRLAALHLFAASTFPDFFFPPEVQDYFAQATSDGLETIPSYAELLAQLAAPEEPSEPIQQDVCHFVHQPEATAAQQESKTGENEEAALPAS